MLPPPNAELARFIAKVSPNNPGIGIVDRRTGQIYLTVASALADGDHASLAEEALGIVDVDQAVDLRGFVVGVDSQGWRIVNNSGLNPDRNRMEQHLFEDLKELLSRLLPLRPKA